MAAVSKLDDRSSPKNLRARVATRSGRLLALAAATALALAAAGSAGALEGLSPAQVSAAEGGACPALTQIKYPWISCQANEYGGVTLSSPSLQAPLACYLRLADGTCAASPEAWQLEAPIIGPGPGK
jgi:hypothetical protein